MLSVFSSLLPEVEGGDWVGHKEEPKDPPGFTKSRGGGAGAICSPGCRLQGAEWATGRAFQAPACRAAPQASFLWEWAPGGHGWGLSGLRG